MHFNTLCYLAAWFNYKTYTESTNSALFRSAALGGKFWVVLLFLQEKFSRLLLAFPTRKTRVSCCLKITFFVSIAVSPREPPSSSFSRFTELQTFYFLLQSSRARTKKKTKPLGIEWARQQGNEGGGSKGKIVRFVVTPRSFSRARFARSLRTKEEREQLWTDLFVCCL